MKRGDYLGMRVRLLKDMTMALGAWALLVAVAMARAVREIARDGDDG